MPEAWAILGTSLALLVLLEVTGPLGQGLRQTTFLAVLAPPAVLPHPTPWPTPQPLRGPAGPLKTSPARVARLLAKGPAQAGKPLRIAYFGDSMIEGDLICEPLRRQIQERFGGSGVGWVGMAPLDAWARDDIQQRFDPAWERHSILIHDWEGLDYGPQMASWTLKRGKGGVHFKGVPGSADYAYLAPATLWYGPVPTSGKAQVTVKIDGRSKLLALTGDQPVNALVLSTDPCKKLDLAFEAPKALGYFGVSFDQGSGVDCFSSRGSHGGQMARLDLEMLKGLQAQRHYDLVITQYGVNAIGQYQDKTFKWYRRSLVGGLKRLQEGLDPVAIVLVSAADRAVHRNNGWVSDPDLPGLLTAQRAVARDVGIPFINAFDLMGGPGTMAKWGQADPRLAERDFTHMTPQGATRFEAALWRALQKGGRSSEIR
jgi:lysophospholipase L1-like esterase